MGEFIEKARLGIDKCYSKGALTLLWKAVNDLQQRVDASGSFDFRSSFSLTEPNKDQEMAGTLNDETETAHMELLADLNFEEYDSVFDLEANDDFNDM